MKLDRKHTLAEIADLLEAQFKGDSQLTIEGTLSHPKPMLQRTSGLIKFDRGIFLWRLLKSTALSTLREENTRFLPPEISFPLKGLFQGVDFVTTRE